MKVFVTGIAGFLGAHVAREAVSRGWEATGIDSMLSAVNDTLEGIEWKRADCRDADSYADLIRGADVIYHCAAAPYEGLSVFSPQIVFENTLLSTVGLLRASVNAGARRFIFTSSMSRYGHGTPPFTEEMPTAPVDPYGVAKVSAENAVKNICDLHGLEWVIAVPHNIYGPGQRYWDPFRNVGAIMVNRIFQGKRPIVYGDGSQRRCLSYISDVTGPLLKMATEDVAGEIFNVGPDDEGCTILELAQLLMNLCGMPGEPEFFPARPAEVHIAHCSAARIRARLGYEPQMELKDGLQVLIDWIREKGPRPFDYHLPLEITGGPLQAPRTWTERLI